MGFGACRIGFAMGAFRTEVFAVSGMTCGNCVQHVESALLRMEEVTKVKVNLRRARARVTYSADTEPSALFDAVQEIGYEMGPRSAPG